jgi:glycine/D-amino acid oxidase-like deaminating enzyme
MKVGSVWSSTAARPHFDRREGDLQTDVLVIGGGMTGILCAYMLRRAGVSCLLAEADRICGGITKNTTAKITVQHGLMFDDMLRRFGEERARLYVAAQTTALEEYRALCREVDCDFEEQDSYVYSTSDRRKLEREVAALERLGCAATLEESLPIPVPTVGAVRVPRQAQFHPLKFAYAIAEGLPILEDTRVMEVRGGVAITNRGRIHAERFIVATHFPFINKHGGYFLKMYQHRSYVLGLEGAPEVDGMYVDESQTGLSFRSYDGTLLLGGGGHRTGKQGGGWAELSAFAKRHYPEAREVYRWATQDCVTLDDMPYIGRYAKGTPNLYVATGYNKWGMTSSMVAATLLSDLVRDRDNPYAEVFDPSRSVLRPRLASNVWEATVGLVTPTAPRCPHMGCVLKYNSQEHTWDCPCHGSRFDRDGKLIDNPATGDKH